MILQWQKIWCVFNNFHSHSSTGKLFIEPLEKERLDYVDDYQDLYTSSETLDIELFQIPSLGLFAAMAHRATKPGSAIYRWDGVHFQLYQNISTFKAQAWKQFTIGGKVRTSFMGKELNLIFSAGDGSFGIDLSI